MRRHPRAVGAHRLADRACRRPTAARRRSPWHNGDAARAAGLLRSAADGYAAAGAEWEAAVSRVELAEALAAQGMPAEIPGLLAAAEPALRRAGALAELARWETLAARFP